VQALGRQTVVEELLQPRRLGRREDPRAARHPEASIRTGASNAPSVVTTLPSSIPRTDAWRNEASVRANRRRHSVA